MSLIILAYSMSPFSYDYLNYIVGQVILPISLLSYECLPFNIMQDYQSNDNDVPLFVEDVQSSRLAEHRFSTLD